jgi:hypothetical protein
MSFWLTTAVVVCLLNIVVMGLGARRARSRKRIA